MNGTNLELLLEMFMKKALPGIGRRIGKLFLAEVVVTNCENYSFRLLFLVLSAKKMYLGHLLGNIQFSWGNFMT